MSIFRSSFSKVPKHARFEYEPRYSKPSEEDKEEGKRIRYKRDRVPFERPNAISGKLRRSTVALKKKEARKRMTRLYILLAVVLALLLILSQNL
jgi:hypothetical protein